MTKVLYTLNASCRHPTQYFAVSQSKVPHFDLMSSITSGITTSPQNRFLYSRDNKNYAGTAPYERCYLGYFKRETLAPKHKKSPYLMSVNTFMVQIKCRLQM